MTVPNNQRENEPEKKPKTKPRMELKPNLVILFGAVHKERCTAFGVAREPTARVNQQGWEGADGVSPAFRRNTCLGDLKTRSSHSFDGPMPRPEPNGPGGGRGHQEGPP